MSFSEAIKEKVKIRADFTCCWCNDHKQKVEVHHIIPEAASGPDDEDNAAPLCSNCHTLYGGNPDLRKEIRARRDHWYDICLSKLNPQHNWPIGLDVPLLKSFRPIAPQEIFPLGGILLTDELVDNKEKPPILYLAINFKTSRYFWPNVPQNEKWLYLEANMRPAFNLRIQVEVHDTAVKEVMRFLNGDGEGWTLFGALPIIAERLSLPEDRLDLHARDQLELWRENDERRIMISTFTSTNAGMSIHARLSNEVAKALADYLAGTSFISGVDLLSTEK
ncbi:MAG: HNH endonuclease [Chloroflexi bacterium]|nr:HNH endonuclease [Chloroflexota bacterium]NOG66454.1 HNH endonuclease [Chloroflexota bacterium]